MILGAVTGAFIWSLLCGIADSRPKRFEPAWYGFVLFTSAGALIDYYFA